MIPCPHSRRFSISAQTPLTSSYQQKLQLFAWQLSLVTRPHFACNHSRPEGINAVNPRPPFCFNQYLTGIGEKRPKILLSQLSLTCSFYTGFQNLPWGSSPSSALWQLANNKDSTHFLKLSSFLHLTSPLFCWCFQDYFPNKLHTHKSLFQGLFCARPKLEWCLSFCQRQTVPLVLPPLFFFFLLSSFFSPTPL